MADDDLVMNAQQAMAFLGVKRTFLTDHLAELGGSKLGGGRKGRLRFRKSLLVAYLEHCRVQPADGGTPIAPERERRRPSMPKREGINPVTRKPWGYYANQALTEASR